MGPKFRSALRFIRKRVGDGLMRTGPAWISMYDTYGWRGFDPPGGPGRPGPPPLSQEEQDDFSALVKHLR